MPRESYAFLAALGATLLAITATAWFGRRGRRRPHVGLALVSAVSFAVTIAFAIDLGRHLTFPAGIHQVHMVSARAGFVAFLAVVTTGLALLRAEAPRRRRWHRAAIVVFLMLVGAATVTGLVMLAQSAPRGV